MNRPLPLRPPQAPAAIPAPLLRHSMPLVHYQQAMAEYGPSACQEVIGIASPQNHLHFATTSD
jgi:hypothetical protein